MPTSFVRVLVVGSTAALISGVFCAGLGRVLMRLFVVAGGRLPTFSIVGSLLLIAIFVISVLPGAVASAATVQPTPLVVLYALGVVIVVYTGVAIGVEEWTAAINHGVSNAQAALLVLLTLGIAVLALGNPVLAHRIALRLSTRSPIGTGPPAERRTDTEPT